MYNKILVALDGSEVSDKALSAAVELARAVGASLHALAVEEHLPRYAATVGEVEEAQEEQTIFFSHVLVEAARIAANRDVQLTTEVRAGNAAQQIVQLARDGGFDLIVLGAKGHNLVRDFLLGSTTDRVIHHARCSVLAVR